MRPLELVLLGLLAARALGVPARGPWGAAARGALATAAGIVWVAHLALEGARWPMMPAYALVAVYVVLLVFERPHAQAPRLLLGRNRHRRDPLPWGRLLAATSALVVATALAWAFPVPRLPAPTGPWAVGSVAVVLELQDATGAAVGAGGRTMARLWYPTPAPDAAAGRSFATPADGGPARGPAPWIERADRVLPAMASSGGLPDWVFGPLGLVRTHATWAAPLASPPTAAGWPVVTFDHGYGGFRSQNTFLAEDLASRGAVVVAVEHPGGGLLTVLPDGTERPFTPLPPSDDPGYAAAVTALGARWTAETLAALGALARPAPEGPLAPFAGALDLGRVIASGHSTGGGVAVDVCHAWSGCVAVLALDAWWRPVDPQRRAAGSDRPVVSIASDPALGYFAPANRDVFVAFAAAGRGPVVDLVLAGSGHHDLNDTALLSPIADRFGHSTGPVPAREAFAALRAVAGTVLEAVAAAPPGATGPTDRAVAPADEVAVIVARAAQAATVGHPVLVPGATAFAAVPARE